MTPRDRPVTEDAPGGPVRRAPAGGPAAGIGAADPDATTAAAGADDAAGLPPAARRLLGALLALDADRARSVRAQAARARPRRQDGPTVDLGD